MSPFRRVPARPRSGSTARAAEAPRRRPLALADFVRGCSEVAVAPRAGPRDPPSHRDRPVQAGPATNWELARVTDGVVSPARGHRGGRARGGAAVRPASTRRAAMVDAVRATEFRYAQYDGLSRATSAARGGEALRGAFLQRQQPPARASLALLEAPRRRARGARRGGGGASPAASATPAGGARHACRGGCGALLLRGKPVLEAVDALLDLSFFSGVHHVSIAPYERAMAALPRARALRLAERRLAQPFRLRCGPAPLLAHRDDALLGRFLSTTMRPTATLRGERARALLAEAFPTRARIWDLPPRTARRACHRAAFRGARHDGRPRRDGRPAMGRGDHLRPGGRTSPSATGTACMRHCARGRCGRCPSRRARAQLLRWCRRGPWPERAKEAAAAGARRRGPPPSRPRQKAESPVAEGRRTGFRDLRREHAGGRRKQPVGGPSITAQAQPSSTFQAAAAATLQEFQSS